MHRKLVIVEALRTPHGRFGGKLKDRSAVDLGVVVVKALLERSGVGPEAIEEVILGCGWQAGAGPNPARLVAVKAGLPVSVPATSVNVRCGSSLKATIMAAQAILAGDREMVLVGGMESTSNVPYALPGARWGLKMGDEKVRDLIHHDGFLCPLAEMLMGTTADFLAEEFSISRKEQDALAWGSQNKAAQAVKSGAMLRELVPVQLRDGTLDADETPRPGTTPEALADLPPVFRPGGTVTAGNSCAMADGASAVLLASGEAADGLGLRPLGRILGYSHVGVEPRRMGIGPVAAVPLALRRAQLSWNDVEILEINEAFAAQVLACQRELGFSLDVANPHGGAIALGHPVAATGTRLIATLVHALHRLNRQYGLITLCIGGGQGIALVVERL